MYPVLKIMYMLNFLDKFSMGVTGTFNLPIYKMLPYRLKSRFRDKEHSKTFHFTKYKTKYVHISCFKSREMLTFLFLKLVSI